VQSGLYVGLSAQLALQRRLNTVANNVANASTPGYRAEEVKFEALLSRETAPGKAAFVSMGEPYITRTSGGLTKTDSPFDVAIAGNAWLSISTPAGQVYTRDGRMQMSPTGQLLSVTGHPILDSGGAPIQLNPRDGAPKIARDGMITQGTRQVGAIGLFNIPEGAKLTRFENSGVIPDQPATAALDFNRTSVAQGYIEESNVNPVAQITRLIEVSRAFDAVTASMKDSDNSLKSAISTLGSSTG
jgi:flagellar basal-body rod protein FlgF